MPTEGLDRCQGRTENLAGDYLTKWGEEADRRRMGEFALYGEARAAEARREVPRRGAGRWCKPAVASADGHQRVF